VKVWVIYSDCGLNGPWIHAVRSTEPTETPEQLRRMYAERQPAGGNLPGGYQHTHVEEWEVDGAESRNAG
jgi:hypothetical protein